VREERGPKFISFSPHYIMRVAYPRCNHWILDHCVSADDVNRFAPLIGRQFCNSQPGELEDGGGVFASAVAYDPRNVVGLVKISDLLLEAFDGCLESKFGEGRGFIGGRHENLVCAVGFGGSQLSEGWEVI